MCNTLLQINHHLLNAFSNIEYLGCFKIFIINDAAKNMSERNQYLSI